MNTIYCSQDSAREEEKSAAEEKRDVRGISRAISTYTESKLKL